MSDSHVLSLSLSAGGVWLHASSENQPNEVEPCRQIGKPRHCGCVIGAMNSSWKLALLVLFSIVSHNWI